MARPVFMPRSTASRKSGSVFNGGVLIGDGEFCF